MTKFIASAATARKLDEAAIQGCRIPSLLLMEHAAQGCAKIIQKKAKKKQRTVLVCGPGNNGADGMAIARILALKKYHVCVLGPDPLRLGGDEKIQYEMIDRLSIPYIYNEEECLEMIRQADLLVDCLFGSGLNRPVAGKYAAYIEAVNQNPAWTFSVDIPSGLDGTNGQILGTAVKSDLVLALDCIKTGELCSMGRKICRRLKVIDIEIPWFLHKEMDCGILLTRNSASRLLPARGRMSHKGNFGKVLLIGGSRQMHGAISMAALACYHSGCGTLTLLVPGSLRQILAVKMNQAMILSSPDSCEILDDLALEIFNREKDKFSLIAAGSGMGTDPKSRKLIEAVLASKVPVLLDADALNLIAGCPELLKRKEPVIITPHVKEFSRLTGMSAGTIAENPFEAANAFCKDYPEAILVLKSNLTIVQQGRKQYVLNHPNSALAKGGSGDLLAGIIAGLAAGSNNLLEAAAAGVYLHSLAARTKKDPAAFQPDDLIRHLSKALKTLRR